MGNDRIGKKKLTIEMKKKAQLCKRLIVSGMLMIMIMISSIIPMFDLTIEGIEEAMDYLRKGGKDMYTTIQLLKGLNYLKG